ncbi:transcription elongation factor [Nordella sp. HKS 07]|uniref:GreA/GreB family elongation factor n=1 Tax=Nordella sp. HKS 07 TaxID=2712222 RepID=UPI0013E1CF2C|nr:GreA/GreB family elongation factor [Nordella sp. HKS 07]QIG49670.1 transcription elongation factor [Nordella sp. HKS 07]
MSRAFVKEQDGQETPEELPERPVSTNPNFVTPRGLALIDEEIETARKLLAHAQHETDRVGIVRASRDLRYWTQRRATAQPVDPPKAPKKVAFGTRVTVKRDDGRQQVFSIVGEDEADLEKGLIAYTVPMARALLGLEVGDDADLPGGHAEVVALEPYSV